MHHHHNNIIKSREMKKKTLDMISNERIYYKSIHSAPQLITCFQNVVFDKKSLL